VVATVQVAGLLRELTVSTAMPQKFTLELLPSFYRTHQTHTVTMIGGQRGRRKGEQDRLRHDKVNLADELANAGNEYDRR
jgi:hypothetical protein